MSVVVFIEVKNKVNKAALEAVSYGSKLGPVTVITYGTASEEALSELGDYGAENIWDTEAFKLRARLLHKEDG